jgi:hypothetical protein
VVVKQNDNEPLAIAEIEIYALSNPTVNIAPTATCYMLPSTGSFYNGDSTTGVAPQLNDLLYVDSAHSGSPSSGAGKDWCMCILPQPTPLKTIKVVPRSGWPDRSRDFTLEVYGGIASETAAEYASVRPVGLLWSTPILHASGSWESGQAFDVPTLPASFPCDSRSTGRPVAFQYEAVHGQVRRVCSVVGGMGSARMSTLHGRCERCTAWLLACPCLPGLFPCGRLLHRIVVQALCHSRIVE